jgi:hypothetical protein
MIPNLVNEWTVLLKNLKEGPRRERTTKLK